MESVAACMDSSYRRHLACPSEAYLRLAPCLEPLPWLAVRSSSALGCVVAPRSRSGRRVKLALPHPLVTALLDSHPSFYRGYLASEKWCLAVSQAVTEVAEEEPTLSQAVVPRFWSLMAVVLTLVETTLTSQAVPLAFLPPFSTLLEAMSVSFKARIGLSQALVSVRCPDEAPMVSMLRLAEP